MDKLERLRAQIAALQDATMDKNKNFRSAYDEGKFDALSAIDTLLDSMQKEPVSEDLEEAAITAADEDMQGRQIMEESNENRQLYSRIFRRGFKACAKWQEKKDQKTIEQLAEDHAMLAGMEKAKNLKKLADAMYHAAQYMTTDASRLRKAMDEYHRYVIHNTYGK